MGCLDLMRPLIQSTSHNSLLPFSLAQLKWFYSYRIPSFQGIQIDSTSVAILSLSLLAPLKIASVTGCGARKLAVTGRRLLVLLLKRRCAALTRILASRMLRWSSKAKSIQSTRSALSENLPSFLHCAFCFTITLIMLWAAREMFKVPFSRCEPL